MFVVPLKLSAPQTPSARLGERVLLEPCLRRFEGNSLVWPWYLGSECDGGFAEYVKIDASHAHAITSTLSDAELASFPCAYSTAENLLTRAGVVAGERFSWLRARRVALARLWCNWRVRAAPKWWR